MNSFSDFSDLINYIEDNLFAEIDVQTLAKRTKLSIYEFRRIFSFVVGTPVYEYIRKRRLSKCVELLFQGESLNTVSSKCDYENVSSFSRAFKDFHGVSPTEISKNNSNIKTFTKAQFDVKVRGGLEIDYKIIDLEEFYIDGIKGESDEKDTECCENVWQKFNDFDANTNFHKSIDKIYASYQNNSNSVLCTIGKKSNEYNANATYIPKSKWVCFSLEKTDDEFVNSYYKNVIYSWFESTSYVRRVDLPNIEIFPSEMIGNFVWNICIPIE